MTTTRPKLWPYLAAVILAAAVALGVGGRTEVDGERAAFPFPVPIYEIEAVSGDHVASILNLPLPYVGAPEVPVPVDVNGDLLPDVTMSVNLIDPEGLFNNPPDLPDVAAPNVEVRRLLTAPILGQSNPPLRINAKLTLVDLEGEQGPTVVRFGYDTGPGGSIPTDFKAVIGGLADFFNPLVASVDTTAGLLGLDPGLPDLGLGPVAPSYRGPLTLVGGFESDAVDADVELAFDPLPTRLQVTYGTDGEHQEITYAHAANREVDVTTTATIIAADGAATDVTARVDRLPSRMAVDLALGDGTGSIDYVASSDGRLPDIAVDLARHAPEQAPMLGRFEIEALPEEISADWAIAPGAGGTSVDFTSSGAGIGALEARIATFEGDSEFIGPWVPTEEQYLHLATGPEGFDGDTLVEARLERIRSAAFHNGDAGAIEATVDVGDGEEPFAAHVDVDLRAAEDPGPRLDVTATIAPLPDHIVFGLQPAGEPDAPSPLVATYESSETVDVDVHAEVALPGTPPDAACGAVHTVCGDLAIRNLPAQLTASVHADPAPGGETRIELDTVPAEGAALADVHADLVLGSLAEDAQEGDRAMHIEGHALGLPRSATVQLVQDPVDEALREVRFRACDVDPDDACTEATADGHIGEVRFQVANFGEEERPADLLPPQAIAPTWATVTARGLDDPADGMLFEAAGRVTDVRELRYVDVAGVLGVQARLGQSEDFAARIDMQGIDRPGDEPDAGRVDTWADALLRPLPQDIELCFGGAGRALLDEPTDELTAACEPADPFDDGSLDETPMVIDYRGDTEFDVRGSFSTTAHHHPALTLDDETMAAEFDVRGVPTALHAQISTPPADDPGPIRVLTAADDTVDAVDLSFARTTAGATCNDPDPDLGETLCADASVTDLPRWASVVADTSVTDELHLGFHACDWDVTGGGDCRHGDTDDEIGSVAAQVRVRRGDPDLPPHHDAPAGQHAVVLADLGEEGDIALDASVAVDHVRALEVDTTPLGIDARTDLGDGVAPLALHGDVDLRTDDDPSRLRLVADAVVDPLPREITLTQTVTPEDDPDHVLDVVVRASEPATLTGSLKAFPADEDGDGDQCADVGTLCADLTVERIPEELHATYSVGEEELDGDGNPRLFHTNIDVVADPHDGQAKPDIEASATLGAGALGLPIPTEFVADARLEGIPGTLSVHLQELQRQVPPPAGDWDELALGAPTLARTLQAIDVSTGEGQLDVLDVSARTFLLPPPGLPPLAAVAEPNHAIVNGRGSHFEGAVRFTDVRGVRFLTRQIGQGSGRGQLVGFEARVGGGGAFRAEADIQGLRLGELDLLGAQFDDAVVAADAEVVLSNLPSELGFCLRDGGIAPWPDPVGGDLTEHCETDDPFADFDTGLAPPPELPDDRTPLSVSVDTNATIADLDVRAGATFTDLADADVVLHLDGELHVTDLPDELTAHVLMPGEDGTGPIVVRAALPQAPGTAFDVEASAEIRHGDAICYDPRPDARVSCFGARLDDVPERVDVYLDPTRPEDNLSVRAVGGAQLDVTDVRVDLQDGQGGITVVDADLVDLPSLVTGTLRLPGGSDDAPAIAVRATPPLGSATVHFRNFIAPDPFGPDAVPADRAGVPAADQYVHVLKQGGVTRVDAHVESVASAGFRTLRDALGGALDTIVVDAGFGTPGNLRAYADLRTPEGGDGPLAGTRLIIDATLADVPDDVSVCFRPSRDEGAGASPEHNWCEDEVDGGSGAFRLASGAGGLDAYAFLRMASTAGDSLLAATATILDIPAVVEGILPSGGLTGSTLDIGGFESPGGTAAPIGVIDAEIASFDLEHDGYADDDRPYTPRKVEVDPFPVDVVDANAQHVSAALVDEDFHVDARLGPESPLQRLRLLPDSCTLESPPVDYPYFPDDGTDYLCARLELADAEGPGDPLALHIVREVAEQRLELTDAGITDLPPWIAVTLATGAETTYDHPDIDGNEGSLRRPCGSATDEDGGANGDCVAPLVRFDQPADAVLYGTLRVGDRDALPLLDDVEPKQSGVVPDLEVSPGPDGAGWTDWDDPRGVRATVARVSESGAADGDPLLTVVRANLRLDVPRSLTVDQFQQWSDVSNHPVIKMPSHDRQSSDLRFRFVVRDAAGEAVPVLGRVAALLELAPGKQLLLGGAGSEATLGFPLPGEIGVGVYSRVLTVTDQLGEGWQHSFVQVNGRVSTDIDLGAYFVSDGEDANVHVTARADLYNLPGTDHIGPDEPADAPSFVVAIERDVEYSKPSAQPQEEEPEDQCTPTNCTEMAARVGIEAAFDLAPTDGEQTRRLDLYLRTRGAKNSLLLHAWEDPAGTDPALVSGAAILRIDDLSLHLHRGVYLVGSFTLDLGGSAVVPIVIDRVRSLELRHNLVGLRFETDGPVGGGVRVLDLPEFPVDVPIPDFEFVLDWLSVQTWAIGIPVLMATYSNPGGQLAVRFLNCAALGAPWPGITHANNTTSAWVIWPFSDPHIHFTGVFGPLGYLAKHLGPLFCFANAVNIPVDVPLPDYEIEGHPVPYTIGTSEGPPDAEPEPEPEAAAAPDHTVPAGTTLSLCGVHEFGTLTVQGTIDVDPDGNGTSTVEDQLGPRADCPAELGGSLTLLADEIVVGPDGRIEAAAPAVATGAGNGGGGHGGAGGPGSTGAGGPAHPVLDPPYEPEVGQRGGNQGGLGGGALAIYARSITVQPDGGDLVPGTITVAGGDGVGQGNTCIDAEGGVHASGGGAGGTLVISANRVVNGGDINADGGDGGNAAHGGGGGGGGGGGVLELRVLFWEGNDPTADGGQGGSNLCAAEQDDPAPDGEQGEAYEFEIDDSPWSTPLAPVKFWQRPRGLVVPLSAAVPPAAAPNGYEIVLCAVQRPGEEIDPMLPLHEQMGAVMPSPGSVDADHPCGTGTVIGSRTGNAQEIGYQPPGEVTNFDLGPNNQLAASGLTSGITGLWSTVVALPPGIEDCTVEDPDDGCTPLQALPPYPPVVLGIDADKPDVELLEPDPGFESGTGGVTIKYLLEGAAEFPFGTPIVSVRCRNEDGPTIPCGHNQFWALSEGPGEKTVHIEVVDAAGNVGHDQVTGTRTGEFPFVVADISDPSPGPVWHTSPPQIGLNYPFVEDTDVADPPLHYAIDGGPERHCQTLQCQIPEAELAALGPGRHRIGYTGEDRWGHRLSRARYMGDDEGQYLDFWTDYEPPTSQLDVVPATPDGEDGWYVTNPWIVISAIDQDRGSGTDRIVVTVDGAEQDYAGPFQPGPGEHTVCWYTVDVAGNQEAPDCIDVDVDLTGPNAHGAVDGQLPPVPDGQAGWFTSVPPSTVTDWSDGNGSGLPTDGPPIRYRVDRGGYIGCPQPCDVLSLLYHGTGHHQVLWSTVDEAGNVGRERALRFDIDLSPPITAVVVGPMAPAGLNGWYVERPWIRLQAEDPGALEGRASGVQAITYTIDGGAPIPYTGPFQVEPGEHVVCGRAVDRAGNTGPAHCRGVDVDDADPTVEVTRPAPDGDAGWHLVPVDAGAAGTDGISGVDATPLTDPCGHVPALPGGTGPSGTCLSVDGGPFVLADSTVGLGEGVHRLRAFAVDRAGRRSPVIDDVVLVDRSAPVTVARLFSPAPAAEGWYRSPVMVALTPADGDRNSGVVGTEYRIGGGPWLEYGGPFVVGEGVHQVHYRSRDAAGRVEVDRRLDLAVDLTPTEVTALVPNPTVWVQLLGLLGPPNAQLRWRVTENLADHVRVQVIVYDTLGNVVRSLDGGTHAVTPGVPLEGHTLWDGMDHTLLGIVPVGLYHYRVVVTDEAGNTSQSGESRPIQLKVAVCLPLVGCL